MATSRWRWAGLGPIRRQKVSFRTDGMSVGSSMKGDHHVGTTHADDRRYEPGWPGQGNAADVRQRGTSAGGTVPPRTRSTHRRGSTELSPAVAPAGRSTRYVQDQPVRTSLLLPPHPWAQMGLVRGEKGWRFHARSVCPPRFPTIKCANCSTVSATQSTRPAWRSCMPAACGSARPPR